MTTGASIFSGGEGIGVGMHQAGIEHLWGVEYDDDIANVARANGFHAITADVREIDIKKLERPDILHASPVCKNASVAKTDGAEAPEDVETAFATCRFIEMLRPDIFTLENVWGYRKFVAFDVILKCLRHEGYAVDFWHLNSADYGVPQTRKRLILVARLRGIPRKPEATHSKHPSPMFGLKKWVGWYEAIEDLIPALPESHFAEWQMKRLPEFCDYTMTVDSVGYPDDGGVTVPVMRKQDDPTNTIVSNYCRREMRAFIVEGSNGSHEHIIRNQDEPCQTLAAEYKSTRRAWLSQGRVVAMTPRCLARFQSFPDSYILPGSNKLACVVIVNAVPPLLYQKVIEAQL